MQLLLQHGLGRQLPILLLLLLVLLPLLLLLLLWWLLLALLQLKQRTWGCMTLKKE